MTRSPDPYQPHAHDPNPHPPSPDPGLVVQTPDGRETAVSVAALRALPPVTVPDCYIVSTGHGTSGPFAFTGAALLDLVQQLAGSTWTEVAVVSGDGFGNRVQAAELRRPHPAGPIILAYAVDGRPLTRAAGLVRLVVPGERDDALRQVKWVAQVQIRQA